LSLFVLLYWKKIFFVGMSNIYGSSAGMPKVLQLIGT